MIRAAALRSLTLRLVVVCLLIWFAFGCATYRAPRPSEITKIVISVNCLSPCTGYQIGLYSDGTYRYDERGLPPADEERGKTPFASWSDAIVHSEFFRTEFLGYRPHYVTALDANETAVWVGYDSTAKQVIFDTSAHDKPSLRNFISRVSESVADARALSRRELIARLSHFKDVRSLQMQVGGCLGGCRAYNVTFDLNGRAQIAYSPPRSYQPRASSPAVVSFDRVLRILRETNYQVLRAQYPFRTFDTESVRLTVRYRDFQYDVYAPDSTSRPPALTEILGRVDGLVEDIDWQPPLPKGTDVHLQAR